MSPTSLPVEHISDTAFLTAYYRAIESGRPDAHFHDPYAQILAGARGENLAHAIPEGNSVALGCAVRTCVIDELVLQTIAEDNIDTVLSLGAGLDTRPYRLPLPSSLCWIDADLPAVLSYKAEKLETVQPRCLLRSVPLNLTNQVDAQTLFQSIGTTANRVLVITEGLLVYLSSEQVADLASKLHSQLPFRWWVTDLSSPAALQQIQKVMAKTLGNDGVTLRFAPEEGTDFFQPYGWNAVEFRSFFEEAQRLKRGELPQEVMSQLSPKNWEMLRRMSGFVLLTRSELYK